MDLADKCYINQLFDRYGSLLTVKQQSYLQAYFEDDLSIVEIAENEAVSRQAVSDNLHRGVDLLRKYESVLHLVANDKCRQHQHQQLRSYLAAHYPADQQLILLAEALMAIDD